jgi:hypothetical protein
MHDPLEAPRAPSSGSLGHANQRFISEERTTPPAVVATMLGYSYQVTEKHAAQAGGKYATYGNLLDNDL